MEGIFAVYKPRGMKSHDVVDFVRRQTGIKRVGHGGTLDPLAEGVLVIAVGRQNTKKLNQYVKGDKEYIAEIKLGQTSTTDDEDGILRQAQDKKTPNPTLEEVELRLRMFVGMIKQVPPIYSSIKLSGKPAHRRVRQGQKVELKPRGVEIKRIELISYDYPVVKIKVVTGPGVYIRSLARDIGQELKTGGFLKSLVRTKAGEFTIENAIKIKDTNKD